MNGLPEQDYELLLKLVLVGDSGVGKSNLLSRFTNNEFNFDSKSTIGVDFGTKSFELDGKIVKVQAWDTAGQERYRSITSAFYRGASGALLVYDITNRSTFDSIPRWLKEVQDYGSENLAIMLVGNKRDLKGERQVTVDEAREFCQLHKLFFIEASALTANNVRIAFETLVKHVYIQTMKANPTLNNIDTYHNHQRFNNQQNNHNNNHLGNNNDNNHNNKNKNNDIHSDNTQSEIENSQNSGHRAISVNLKDDKISIPKEKKCCQ